jgi:peptidoglycan/xylan/chitin deacetylase (PgdA/CDA1 family)
VKSLVGWALYLSGAISFASWWHRKHVVILNYHGISDNAEQLTCDPLDLTVSSANFRWQIEYLRRKHNVISLNQFLEARTAGKELPNYSVLLTFDDGYRNFLNVAPLLLSLNMPVTLFLVTDMVRQFPEQVETAGEFDDRLSWDEIESLDGQGVFSFGSHTCSHPSLTHLSEDAVDNELRASLLAIKGKVKNVTPALAYPNGAHSKVTKSNLVSNGYVCGLTIDPGPNSDTTDLYALRRQTIRGHDDPRIFAARLSCLTGWLYGLRLATVGATGSNGSRYTVGETPLVND